MTALDNTEKVDTQTSGFEPHKVFSGVRWTGVGQVAMESVRTLVSIVLARLLLPADFGLAAMASVVTGFLVIIQYLGTGGVVIQRKELPDSLLDSLFLLNLVFGILLSVGLLMCAPLLASVYNNTEVTPIIRVYAISFVVTAFGAVPGSLLNRAMDFGKLTKISLVASAFSATTGVGMAFMGFGVWALVISSLVSAVITTTLQWFAISWRPHWRFNWEAVKPNFSMMMNLTGMNVIQYFTVDSDKFVVGKWMGDVKVGYYAMASRFCLYPVLTIAPILTKVLYPAYSRLQDDDEGICKMMLRSAGAIAFITLPLMVGLAILARPFVFAVLGAKWEPSMILMILLAPVGVFQSIAAGSSGVLLAKDKSNWLLWIAVIRGIVTFSGLLIGLYWGLAGVAVAYAITTILLTWTVYMIAFRLIHLSPWRLVGALRPYAIINLVMGVSVFLGKLILEKAGSGPWIVLLADICLGILVYLVTTLIVRPPALRDVIRILPTGLQRRLPASLVAWSETA